MDHRPFRRCEANPLLTPPDLPLAANAVFNPGIAETKDGIVLLLRIEIRQGISQLRVARSANGVDNWKVSDRPLLEPDLPEYPYEEWGCEDARITQVGDQKWIVAYTAYSRYGPAVALATTQDFESVERIGVVLAPTNKDAALLPQKFENKWLMLHRPVTGGQEHIWYARANDYSLYWGSPGVLLPQRGGPWWDALRVGVGAPPILTDEGWLLIYHGVKEMGNRPLYRLGVALLDKDDPRRLAARAGEWVFAPEADYERGGLIPGVVYTCGAIRRGDEIWMYYGGADTVTALAIAKLSNLLSFVHEYDYLHMVGREKGMRQ